MNMRLWIHSSQKIEINYKLNEDILEELNGNPRHQERKNMQLKTFF